MATNLAPLAIPAAANFTDRIDGTVTSLDIDEAWEVLNVTVTRGLFKRVSVRLPFSTVRAWSWAGCAFNCTSAQAYAREIPPIAAPARPVSPDTPVALPGVTLAGLIVGVTTRQATELIFKLGAGYRRAPVAGARFDGKTLHPGLAVDAMAVYKTDVDIEDAVSAAIVRNKALMPDELRHLDVRSSGGIVTLSGNVRTSAAKQRAAAAASVPGVIAVQNDIVDDMDLEVATGRALASAGLQRTGEVYARSILGSVTVFGTVLSERVAEDIVRTLARVPGVRTVTSRIEVRALAPA